DEGHPDHDSDDGPAAPPRLAHGVRRGKTCGRPHREEAADRPKNSRQKSISAQNHTPEREHSPGHSQGKPPRCLSTDHNAESKTPDPHKDEHNTERGPRARFGETDGS